MPLIYTIQVLNNVPAIPIPGSSRNDQPSQTSTDDVPTSMADALSTNRHGKQVPIGLSIGEPFRMRLQALDTHRVSQVQEQRELQELKERERRKRDVQFFHKVRAATMTSNYSTHYFN